MNNLLQDINGRIKIAIRQLADISFEQAFDSRRTLLMKRQFSRPNIRKQAVAKLLLAKREADEPIHSSERCA